MNKESVKAKFSENNITLKLVPAISRKCHKIIEPAWSLRGQVKVDQNGRILKVFKLPKGAVNLSNHLFIVIINKKIKPIFNMI
jgi:hypothetical protein